MDNWEKYLLIDKNNRCERCKRKPIEVIIGYNKLCKTCFSFLLSSNYNFLISSKKHLHSSSLIKDWFINPIFKF